jgi:perosamine synthetase
MPEIKYQGAQPFFPPEDRIEILRHIDEILQTGRMTQGRWLLEFEKSAAAMAGTRFACGVNSGGTALELVLESLGLNGAEVIVPADTFVATPNSVIRAGGKPIFADIAAENLSLTLRSIQSVYSAKTKGVIIVHMFGIMSTEISAIREFCRQQNIFLLEDAAHAHGASYRGIPAGSLGIAGCFSYYATKVISTGEGGMITTDDENLSAEVKSLRDHGRTAASGLFDRAGNNFRLAEIPALLGAYQHKRLLQIVDHRRHIAAIYYDLLKNEDLLTVIDPQPRDQNVYWRYPVLLEKCVNRLKLQDIMADKFQTRITWMYEPLCHRQPFYLNKRKYSPKTMPVSEDIMERLVNLPTHMDIDFDDAQKIACGLLAAVKEAASK